MRESIIHDLSEGKWAGKEGQDALHLFIELVGIDSSTDDSYLSQEAVKDTQIVRHLFLSLRVQLISVNSRNNRLLFQLLQPTIHLTLKNLDDLSFKPNPHKPPNPPVAHMLKLSSQIVWNLKSECDKHWLTGFPKLKDITSI